MAKSTLGMDRDDGIPEQKDIGLNGPEEYVYPHFVTWVLSGYIVYPNGKSSDEQPLWLIEDFQALLWRYNWHIDRLRPKTKPGAQ